MKNENAAYFRWPLSEKFLRIIFSVFVLVFVVVVLRLFSPFRAMRERVGGFAADCREALDLTLLMPIPVFPVVWSVLLMLFILVLRRKM